MESLSWLAIVRHGQSTGNVIAEQAERAGQEVIDIPERDADVPLSATGREQAQAVGVWVAGLPGDERPTLAVVSPYLRARQTAELALAGIGLPLTVDERLRDRELGVLDTLTWRGVEALHPEEAARRRFLGKYYHRPPGGESWVDVALRLRSVLHDIEDSGASRVLVVTHDAVVLLIRGVLEGLEEAELMESSRTDPVKNASVTRLVRGAGGWSAEPVNDVSHLGGVAPPTEHGGEHHGTRT